MTTHKEKHKELKYYFKMIIYTWNFKSQNISIHSLSICHIGFLDQWLLKDWSKVTSAWFLSIFSVNERLELAAAHLQLGYKLTHKLTEVALYELGDYSAKGRSNGRTLDHWHMEAINSTCVQCGDMIYVSGCFRKRSSSISQSSCWNASLWDDGMKSITKQPAKVRPTPLTSKHC